MLGKVLEGTAWFATLSLATLGALTFAPDGAWKTFPAALRPVRAKLADFGVAPAEYRTENGAETSAETGLDETALAKREGQKSGESDWRFGTRVRVGDLRRTRQIAETSAKSELNGGATSGFGGVLAGGDFGAFDVAPAASAFEDGVESEIGSAVGDVAEYSEADAIPPFVAEQTDAAASETDVLATADLNGFDNLNNETAVSGGENLGAVPEIATSDPVAENFEEFSDFNAPTEAIPETEPTADAGFAPFAEGGSENGGAANVGGVLAPLAEAVSESPNPTPPVDEAGELRAALAAASAASTPEEIKTVFGTLNRIRNERGARLAAEDATALDAALDRLAFEVFYNPAQAILEPRRQTTAGETLATIAEETATTPETLAAINGLSLPNDAPLPVGTTLKTVRGPASAEISISKKELTLRFNGLYAGRFALGVPASSANMRGDFRVVEKLAKPNCDAVDANGRTISIPGGAPENPLGAAWIALDGGVGLQGTNRPELVGQTIPENGGFVFSDREISQLSVLLPVGAVVSIID